MCSGTVSGWCPTVSPPPTPEGSDLARPHERVLEGPALVRIAVAVGLPLAGAVTVAGTFLGKEILVGAGWLGVFGTNLC